MSTVAKAPCVSCPYRQDVPSGIWAPHEYEKLPRYDGEMAEQVYAGAFQLFDCHQKDGNLCAGWIAAHGADNLLACRLNHDGVNEEVWSYESPVPVFSNGQEARDHGMRDIDNPSLEAHRTMERLIRKRGE